MSDVSNFQEELLPVEYYDIQLNAETPYFSSFEGMSFEHEAAPDHSETIDIAYTASGDGRAMLASPGALAETDVYGENTLEWGTVTSFFRLTELSPEDFDALEDFRLLDYYFNKGEEVPLPEPYEDGTHLFFPAGETLTPGTVLAFYGAYGLTGLMRIKSIDADHLLFDVKVQPEE